MEFNSITLPPIEKNLHFHVDNFFLKLSTNRLLVEYLLGLEPIGMTKNLNGIESRQYC